MNQIRLMKGMLVGIDAKINTNNKNVRDIVNARETSYMFLDN